MFVRISRIFMFIFVLALHTPSVHSFGFNTVRSLLYSSWKCRVAVTSLVSACGIALCLCTKKLYQPFRAPQTQREEHNHRAISTQTPPPAPRLVIATDTHSQTDQQPIQSTGTQTEVDKTELGRAQEAFSFIASFVSNIDPTQTHTIGMLRTLSEKSNTRDLSCIDMIYQYTDQAARCPFPQTFDGVHLQMKMTQLCGTAAEAFKATIQHNAHGAQATYGLFTRKIDLLETYLDRQIDDEQRKHIPMLKEARDSYMDYAQKLAQCGVPIQLDTQGGSGIEFNLTEPLARDAQESLIVLRERIMDKCRQLATIATEMKTASAEFSVQELQHLQALIQERDTGGTAAHPDDLVAQRVFNEEYIESQRTIETLVTQTIDTAQHRQSQKWFSVMREQARQPISIADFQSLFPLQTSSDPVCTEVQNRVLVQLIRQNDIGKLFVQMYLNTILGIYTGLLKNIDRILKTHMQCALKQSMRESTIQESYFED